LARKKTPAKTPARKTQIPPRQSPSTSPVGPTPSDAGSEVARRDNGQVVPRQGAKGKPAAERSHGADDDQLDGIEAQREVRKLGARILVFLLLLLGCAIDLAFIGGWLVMHQLADQCFELLGSMARVTRVERQIMEYMFDGVTLALVGAYILRDLYVSVRRIWRSW
jgi:hypothetical protein